MKSMRIFQIFQWTCRLPTYVWRRSRWGITNSSRLFLIELLELKMFSSIARQIYFHVFLYRFQLLHLFVLSFREHKYFTVCLFFNLFDFRLNLQWNSRLPKQGRLFHELEFLCKIKSLFYNWISRDPQFCPNLNINGAFGFRLARLGTLLRLVVARQTLVKFWLCIAVWQLF